MKKYISPILSIIVGALTFGMYAAPAYYVSDYSTGMAYDLVSFSEYAPDSIIAFSVFSIILFVLAGCLIISGLFMILQNMKVIKSKPITKINTILLVLTAIIAIVALVCYSVYYADLAQYDFSSSLRIGATSITLAVVSLAAVIANIFTSKK